MLFKLSCPKCKRNNIVDESTNPTVGWICESCKNENVSSLPTDGSGNLLIDSSVVVSATEASKVPLNATKDQTIFKDDLTEGIDSNPDKFIDIEGTVYKKTDPVAIEKVAEQKAKEEAEASGGK